jgi:hypothetical protein
MDGIGRCPSSEGLAEDLGPHPSAGSGFLKSGNSVDLVKKSVQNLDSARDEFSQLIERCPALIVRHRLGSSCIPVTFVVNSDQSVYGQRQSVVEKKEIDGSSFFKCERIYYLIYNLKIQHIIYLLSVLYK